MSWMIGAYAITFGVLFIVLGFRLRSWAHRESGIAAHHRRNRDGSGSRLGEPGAITISIDRSDPRARAGRGARRAPALVAASTCPALRASVGEFPRSGRSPERRSIVAEGEKIIGIDLGTTNSVVAVMEGGDVKVIPNQEGSRLTPSVVAFTSKGETLVGEPAKRQAVTNPKGTIYSIKRFMGRRHSEVQAEEKMVPYEVVGGPDDFVKVRVSGKEYTPPEISACILRKLKEAAESHLGHKVRKAVITVPAYFNDSQRQATKDAGQIAGLEVARIINEPTAAALAYGLDKKKNEKIAVFDLGGGTFDISILDVADGVFEVLSTNGDTHLGGDDWDEALINYIADRVQEGAGRRPAQGPDGACSGSRRPPRRPRRTCSFQTQADINLPFITADQNGPKHLTMTITRSQFEQLTDDLFERCAGRSRRPSRTPS